MLTGPKLDVQGKHVIHVDHDIFGPTCGLLPFAAQLDANTPPFAPTIVTSGLEWNLGESVESAPKGLHADQNFQCYADGEQSAIGGFLSTSNHLKADIITIEVDAPILWTMEVKEDE
jgi:thiamine pyrophosphokinase